MERSPAPWQLYVGVDIATDTFTAARLLAEGEPSAPLTREQGAAGYAALQQRLQRAHAAAADTLVVLEATGRIGSPAPSRCTRRATRSA